MQRNNTPQPWEFDPYDSYFPITYEGVGVGFCKLDFADRIVAVLNQDEKLRKALQLACFDLIRQSGGDLSRVEELMKKYLERSERPKHGTGAIAGLLRDRREELNMSDREFTRFCESYKLSAEALKDIYDGKQVSNTQLAILARILRKSVEELMEVRDAATKLEYELRHWKTREARSNAQKTGTTNEAFHLTSNSDTQARNR